MGKTIKINCKEPSSVSDVCWNCKNFDGRNPAERLCSAFPKGIPSEIWNGQNNHLNPYPGDNGIRFEPISRKIAA